MTRFLPKRREFEQGIFAAWQGIFAGEQGIFAGEQGIYSEIQRHWPRRHQNSNALYNW
jgi:hypothetical protein